MNAIQSAVFPTETGWICFVTRGNLLCELTFGHDNPRAAAQAIRHYQVTPTEPNARMRQWSDRLQSFARSPADDFLDIKLDFSGYTDFQREVVQQCRRIRIGETISYAQLAERAERPGAARAVGQVMATNRFPLVVPCHRVVGANGSLRGFSARDGLNMKRRLLNLESGQPATASPTNLRHQAMHPQNATKHRRSTSTASAQLLVRR